MKTRFFALVPLVLCGTGSAAILINTTDFTYTQAFNTLVSSGSPTWTDDSTITGWYSNQTQYFATNGSSNTGGLTSYGATSASDRALGSDTGGVTRMVVFRNNLAQSIRIQAVSFTGEQWRRGTSSTGDRMDFSYRVSSGDITDTTSGSWVDFNALDFTAQTAPSNNSGLDGNTNTFSRNQFLGVEVGAGQYVALRWLHTATNGQRDGLAIDNLSVTTAVPEPTAAWLWALAGMGLPRRRR